MQSGLPNGLTEKIDRIVTLAAGYPEASARVVLRLISNEAGLAEFSLFCECIGLEYARLLFDGLPGYAWRLVESSTAPMGLQALHRALEALHSKLLRECFEEPVLGPREPLPREPLPREQLKDPFAFLSGVPRERLERVLETTPIERIALVACFKDRAAVAELAKLLSPQAQKQLVVAASRLHRLPQAVLYTQAGLFAEELVQRLSALEPELEPAPIVVSPPPLPEAQPVAAPAVQPPPFRHGFDAQKRRKLRSAISSVNFEREFEIRSGASAESQKLVEFLKGLPSAEGIREWIEEARQKPRQQK
jgi:hypothetical protein